MPNYTGSTHRCLAAQLLPAYSCTGQQTVDKTSLYNFLGTFHFRINKGTRHGMSNQVIILSSKYSTESKRNFILKNLLSRLWTTHVYTIFFFFFFLTPRVRNLCRRRENRFLGLKSVFLNLFINKKGFVDYFTNLI